MPNAVLLISFSLAEGASAADFLLAAERLNDEYMSKQKGFISWKQLVDGGVWIDQLTWETMEDARRVLESDGSSDVAEKFYSFIDLASCKVQIFSVEKSYGKPSG